jgi:heme A synthase
VKSSWRLVLAAAILAYGGVILGSWVRITGSGMTCPDWPLCHGSLVPPFGNGTLWEWSHRLIALLETPLVTALAIMAWPLRKTHRLIVPTLALIVALFGLQILLGAATVHLSNAPLSVVVHWGTAMAFLAALTALIVFIRAPAFVVAHAGFRAQLDWARRAMFAMLCVTALLAFLTMCIGAYVSSSGAGLACLTIPGCAGEVVVYGSGQFVQMLHRLCAGSCLLAGCATLAFAWRYAWGPVRITISVGVGLLFAQVILGLLNVAWRLPSAVRELHAANAALAFLAFVAAGAIVAAEHAEVSRQRARA